MPSMPRQNHAMYCLPARSSPVFTTPPSGMVVPGRTQHWEPRVQPAPMTTGPKVMVPLLEGSVPAAVAEPEMKALDSTTCIRVV